FFGTATAEVSDTGRTGKVNVVNVSDRAVATTVSLAPIVDTGFGVPLSDGGMGTPVSCSPNQLFSITLHTHPSGATKAYVTHVCAAPQGPVNPLTNVFAAVSVIDTATNTEDTGQAGTAALSRLIAAQGTATSNLLGVPVGMDFRPGTNVAYLASQAGDTVQRINYRNLTDGRGPIVLGPDSAFAQMSTRGTGGIKVPLGIVVAHSTQFAYVANWAERSLSIVDLAVQGFDQDVVSEALPAANSQAEKVNDGLKFFFTGTGRWATRSVNSCGSCHPDGLSDQITWLFAAGPRQSTPLDGTYSKTTPGDQRVLNWTGIFDEMHDFELNTRGTAGGVGAIVTNTAPQNSSRFALDVGQSLDGGLTNITRNDFLSGSTKSVVAVTVLKDWNEVDEYTKTIKPLKAPRGLDQMAIVRGRALFDTHNCEFCHGGSKWTNSTVPYTPSPEKNGSATGTNVVVASGLRTQTRMGQLTGMQAAQNTDTLKVAVETGVMFPDGGTGNVGPERITCVVRNVG
ncbi:MAG TPA: hypothetical protein VGD87_09320, partial [Archangium sp.]